MDYKHTNPPNEACVIPSKTPKSTRRCHICQTDFHLISHLRRHERDVHLLGPFSCDICHKQFSGKSILRRHQREVHRAKQFSCEICHKLFVRKYDCDNHKLTCQSGINGTRCSTCRKLMVSVSQQGTDCDMCRQRFQGRPSTGETTRQFTKWKRKAKTCPVCEKVTKYLARHMRIHTDIFPHKCELCPKRCRDKASLRSHMVSHTCEKKHKCEVCQKSFKRYSGLRMHMHHHTGQYVDRRCKICTRYYGGSYAKHEEKFHNETNEHRCMVCDKVFYERYRLKVHMIVHTGQRREFVCETCGKTFSTSSALSIHRHTHEDRIPCKQCGKFVLSKSMENHMSVHSDVKPYLCEVCGKGFKLLGYLLIHLKSHGSERPHSCNACGSSFKLSHQLSIHQKNHCHPTSKPRKKQGERKSR